MGDWDGRVKAQETLANERSVQMLRAQKAEIMRRLEWNNPTTSTCVPEWSAISVISVSIGPLAL